MNLNFFESIVFILIFTAPAYILPVIIGPIILRLFDDELSKMAVWFTLKPLLATPLWAFTLKVLDEVGVANYIAPIISLTPAIALTGIIIWRFKGLFKLDAKIVSLLIGVDALRWLNTFLWMKYGGAPNFSNPYFTAGLILPNAYAIMALVIIWPRSRRHNL